MKGMKNIEKLKTLVVLVAAPLAFALTASPRRCSLERILKT